MKMTDEMWEVFGYEENVTRWLKRFEGTRVWYMKDEDDLTLERVLKDERERYFRKGHTQCRKNVRRRFIKMFGLGEMK